MKGIKKVLLFIGTALFFLLIVESFLRIVDYQPRNELLSVEANIPEQPIRISDDPILAYEFRENFIGKGYKTNSLGMRDYEHNLEKLPGKYRILVIGDSVTAGSLVKINDTYPEQLEKMLNMDYQEVEVLNAGVDGYNTVQEARYLEIKGLGFDPDLVIVGFVFENDFGEGASEVFFDNQSMVLRYYDRSVKYLDIPFNKFLVNNLYTARLLNNELVKIFKIKKVKKLLLGRSEFISAIHKIKRISEAEDIETIFVLFPTLDKSPQEEREFVVNLLESEGIEYVDLYQKYLNENKTIKGEEHDIVHPNAYGYTIAANEIKKYIEDNKLIK